MGALPPNNNTGLNLDLFISYATAHLGTVGGIINTISTYPPVGNPGPGVLPWTGYFVEPSTPSLSFDILPDVEANLITDITMQDMENNLNEISIDAETFIVDTPIDFDSIEYSVNEYLAQEPQPETKGGIFGLGAGAPPALDDKLPSTNLECTANKVGKKFGGNKLKANLQSGGWLKSPSKEVDFVRTIVDPVKWGPILKEKYGTKLAKCMLACMKTEQGFKGFNYNIGGYDITAGGWQFNEKIHDGYVYVPEGTTGLLKAFVSFKCLDDFFEKTHVTYIQKGFDKVTNADEHANTYYKQWLGGDKATELAFNTYPGIAYTNGTKDSKGVYHPGLYKTLEEYRTASKAVFKSCYQQIEKYVP